MADNWRCLRNSAITKKKLVEASHQYPVHTYMQGLNNESDFREIVKELPPGLKNRHAVACILCQESYFFVTGFPRV